MRSKYRLWYSKVWHPDATGLYEKLGLIAALDPYLFEELNVFKARVFYFSCFEKQMSSVLKDLAFLNSELKAKNKIPLNWRMFEVQVTSLEEFLSTTEGTRVKPFVLLQMFKSLSSEFIQSYQNIKSLTGEYDVYHTRILKNYEKSILDLAKTLLRYHHGR